MKYVKERMKWEMQRAFRTEFSTMLVDGLLEREATDGVFDPVNETYTGGTDALSETIKGLRREFNSRLVDDNHIQNTDVKFTYLIDDYPTLIPELNDNLSLEGISYRVLSAKRDAASVFYTLHLRVSRHE